MQIPQLATILTAPTAGGVPNSGIQKSKEWWSTKTTTHQRIIEPGLVPTIGALLSTDLKWMFAYCERIGCGHSMPIALAPFAIRWGMDASTDLIRERLRCSKCGAKGVALKRPSWNRRGYAVWPSVLKPVQQEYASCDKNSS